MDVYVEQMFNSWDIGISASILYASIRLITCLISMGIFLDENLQHLTWTRIESGLLEYPLQPY